MVQIVFFQFTATVVMAREYGVRNVMLRADKQTVDIYFYIPCL